MNDQTKRSTLRRQINEFGMKGGELQESKIWAQIGKGLCVWLIYKHAELLITHYEFALVVLLCLIAPELVKKLITMRFSGQAGFTERTEHTERSVTVDHPPPKEAQS